MIAELIALISMAFGLGLVHALDADHIAAVSVLSSESTSRRASLVYALRWGLGHGFTLIIMSLVFFKLGEHWPLLVSEVAERLVGLVLIILGLVIFYQLQRHRLAVHFHTHQGFMPHAHWQLDNKNTDKKLHQHKATLIGGLHGMAGSAPLLVSLPLIQQGRLSDLILYIGIFSLGVFFAMISFGGLLGWFIKSITDSGQQYLKLLRLLLAIVSVVIGVRLVSS